LSIFHIVPANLAMARQFWQSRSSRLASSDGHSPDAQSVPSVVATLAVCVPTVHRSVRVVGSSKPVYRL
jgi:hypothetical protein